MFTLFVVPSIFFEVGSSKAKRCLFSDFPYPSLNKLDLMVFTRETVVGSVSRKAKSVLEPRLLYSRKHQTE